MPRLPTAEQLGQRPTPSPRGSIAQVQFSTPDLTAEARADIQLGAAVGELGKSIAALAAREKQKNDAAKTNEAFNEYSKGQLELEVGEKEGYVNVKLGDAANQPLMDEYTKKRSDLKEKIRKGLSNPTQQMEFDQRASVADRQFDARLYTHIANESRAYRKTVHENVLETERRMAALYWQQPGQIELAMLRTNQEILNRAKEEGLDPEREEDRTIISNMSAAAESQIHVGVLAQMLSQGQDTAASSYFNAVKDRMSYEAIVDVSSKINTAKVEGEAMRAADDIWGTAGPNSINAPVRLDVMERRVREEYSDNPTLAKAVIADIRSRAVAHTDAKREFDASNKATVLDKFHNGTPLKELQLMPEYQALDGEARVQLREYILNTGWTEQQRARTNQEYTEGEKARTGFRHYWELSNPAVLSALSEAQILALEPDLGQELTSRLMTSRRAMSDPSKVYEATIDTEMFNTMAAEAGLEPYKQRLSDDEKEYLGRLRNHVEQMVDQAQTQKGGKLTRDEKQELMRGEIDRKVILTTGIDRSLPAASIKPSQRQDIYVGIDDIPPHWLNGAVNLMRSRGIISQELPVEKARVQFKDRLQRAYAVSITGGTSDEGIAILEGRD